MVADSGIVPDDGDWVAEDAVGFPRKSLKWFSSELLELRVGWLVDKPADEAVDDDCPSEAGKLFVIHLWQHSSVYHEPSEVLKPAVVENVFRYIVPSQFKHPYNVTGLGALR